MPVLYKSDGSVEFATVFKVSDDAGELTAIVYAPEHRDSQGDIASAEVIKEMAYSWMQEGASVDLRHDGKTLPRTKAHTAESFIVQKGDPRFADLKDLDGKQVNSEGAWAIVIKVGDPELREAIKRGDIGGVSMAGVAEVEQEKGDDSAPGWIQKAIDKLAALFGRTPTQGQEDIEMNKQELTDILKGFGKELGDSIVAALKPATPAAPVQKTAEQIAAEKAAAEKAAAENAGQKTEEAPVFKGDPTKAEDLEAHALAVDKFNLRKGVNWSDPASVREYATKLAALEKGSDEGDEGAPEGAPEGDEDQTAFEKQIARPAASAQPVKKGAKPADSKIDPRFKDFQVEVAKDMTEGAALADLIGRRRKDPNQKAA